MESRLIGGTTMQIVNVMRMKWMKAIGTMENIVNQSVIEQIDDNENTEDSNRDDGESDSKKTAESDADNEKYWRPRTQMPI
jgi:hypothetical protein